MKENFTHLIPDPSKLRSQTLLKITLLFFLLFVYNAVSAQAPTITSINPGCVAVQQGFELTINGSGFDTRTDQNGATVVITGNAFAGEVVFTPKSRSANQVKVDIAGTNTVLATAGSLIVVVRQNGTDVSNPMQMSVYPTNTTITGPASVCVSATANTANYRVPALGGSTTYAWRILSGSATITSGGTTPEAIVNFSSTSGTVRIEVTVNPNCNGAPVLTTTHNVTVNAAPTVTLAPFNNICTNAGVLTLTGGSPAGGIYTVNGIIATRTDSEGNTISSFDPAAAGVGTHTITYTVTQNGCSSTARQTITVSQAPTVSLAPFSDVCSNAPVFTLTGGSPANGTYAINGIPATTFDPAVVGAGTHTITYTFTQNGCSSTAAQTITVSQAPSVSLNPFLDVCSNAGVITLSGGLPAGGTFTVNGVAATSFDPAAAGVGTHTITYTVTQNGCSSTARQTITVLQTPTVSLAPFANVCSSAPAFALTGGLPAGGTFTVNGVAATSFDPAAAGVGTHTITYSATQNGCTSSITQTITVSQTPTATINVPTTGTRACPGGTVTLNASPTSGANYQWFRNNQLIAGATGATFVAGQTGNYTVQVTNDGCAVTSTAVAVTILDRASIIAEGARIQLCSSQSTILHAISGYFGYRWFKDGQPLSNTTSSLVVTETGAYTVEVQTTLTDCPFVVSTPTQVDVAAPISNNTISTPSQAICAGSTLTIVAPEATGGNNTFTYQWQSSNTGDPNTFSDIKTNGNNPDYNFTSGTFTGTRYFRRVVISGACSDISGGIAITVNPVITGNTLKNTSNQNVCAGSSVTLEGLSPEGGAGPNSYKYQWQSSNDNVTFADIQNATTPDYVFNAGTSTGTQYFRRVVTSGGCTSTSAVVSVTVNPAITDNTITANNTSTCSGGAITITGSVPTGGTGSFTYQWQVSTDKTNFTNIQGATTQDYTFNLSTSGTQHFRRIVTSGSINTGCSSPSNVVSLTVNPVITNNTITTPDRSLCTGTALIIRASTPGGGAGSGTYLYKWQSSDDNVNFVDVNATFSASNKDYLYFAGETPNTKYFRRIASSGSCTNTSPSRKIDVVQTTTYTIILTVAPEDFPVCNLARYTARVIQDIEEVIYPEEPQYEQVTWTGGQDVTSQFTLEWYKNDTERLTVTGNQVSLPGPQSRDYYTVRARPNFSGSQCVLYNNLPDVIPDDRGDNELFSNRIYRGAPFGYAVNIATNAQPSNTVCAGTTVTFTATPSSANFVNPKYQWQVNGQNIQGQTASTFTSSTLSSGDIVTVTFTSDENRCDPITSNPITLLVASPQVLAGGGSYCVSDPLGGVTIQMAGSQTGILYQLMLGSTTVFLPVPGNGGPISFGYHKYAPGTYSVQAIIPSANGNAAVNCSAFGSVEVTHTPALTHTVTITPPTELVVGQPATFIANSSIASYNPTYKWYVFDFTNPNAGFVLQPGANTNTFVLQSVPEGDIEIRVDVQAPTGICVDDADGLVSDVTGQIGPLPVELLYLKATKQDNNVVEVEWATAMEQNSEGFEVQVSQDAQNYRTLAFVNSKASGNTNQKQVYTFHDKENGKYGTRYYRLMQRDMNGDAEYFGPKAVQIGEAAENLSVYPNPFENEINLELNAEEAGTMHVIVTNAIGAKVLERTFNIQKGSNKQSLRFKDGLPLGMYNITTRLNGKTRHLKLMKR
ncbi:hypothetical protein AAE02nite_21870 [Adhaeribacter aerolatus]|uniref:Uncharacterized protein n=1 Tax=Adhaeribacter aerolatus TaxID=670289 RepID=A0A512AXT1_9BACT|nr:T9SS type A sorting domain-containing protein [Adhaeribacter aerolatus]GEO04523.1 hypothetical protein AAE02nite_21870 [Adhaeribacter aerolatus]